jgi:hypothetical protein
MPGPGWKATVEATLRPPPAALDDAGEQEPREVGEAGDVDLQHLKLLAERQFRELALRAEPGVVDQHVHSEAR